MITSRSLRHAEEALSLVAESNAREKRTEEVLLATSTRASAQLAAALAAEKKGEAKAISEKQVAIDAQQVAFKAKVQAQGLSDSYLPIEKQYAELIKKVDDELIDVTDRFATLNRYTQNVRYSSSVFMQKADEVFKKTDPSITIKNTLEKLAAQRQELIAHKSKLIAQQQALIDEDVALMAANFQYEQEKKKSLSKADNRIKQLKIAMLDGIETAASKYLEKEKNKITTKAAKFPKQSIEHFLKLLDNFNVFFGSVAHIGVDWATLGGLMNPKSPVYADYLKNPHKFVDFINGSVKMTLYGYGQLIGRAQQLKQSEIEQIYALEKQQEAIRDKLSKDKEIPGVNVKAREDKAKEEISQLQVEINKITVNGRKIVPQLIPNAKSYIADKQSLFKVKVLFNAVTAECIAQNDADARDLMIEQVISLAGKNTELTYLQGMAKYYRLVVPGDAALKEELVAHEVSQVKQAVDQLKSKSVTRVTQELSDTRLASDSMLELFRSERQNLDHVEAIACEVQRGLQLEAEKVESVFSKTHEQLAEKFKRLNDPISKLNAAITEINRLGDHQDMQLIAIAKNDAIEEKISLEDFFAAARQQHVDAQRFLMEAKAILVGDEKQNSSLPSVEELYFSAEQKLRNAQITLDGVRYSPPSSQRESSRGGKIYRAFAAMGAGKSDYQKAFEQGRQELQQSEKRIKKISAYYASAEKYSASNRAFVEALAEFKKISDFPRKMIDAQDAFIQVIQAGQFTDADLVIIVAEQHKQSAKTAFDDANAWLAIALEAKLAAEKELQAAQVLHGSESSVIYQQMVDYTNKNYEVVLNAQREAQSAFDKAQQMLGSLSSYQPLALQCQRLLTMNNNVISDYKSIRAACRSVSETKVSGYAAVEPARQEVTARLENIRRTLDQATVNFGTVGNSQKLARVALNNIKNSKNYNLEIENSFMGALASLESSSSDINESLKVIKHQYHAVEQRKIPEQIAYNHELEKILNYFKDQLEQHADKFEKEVKNKRGLFRSGFFKGGVAVFVDGKDRKFQTGVAAIIRDLRDDQQDVKRKLEQIKQKVQQRQAAATGIGFFIKRVKGGVVDNLFKQLDSLLKMPTLNFEQFQRALDQVFTAADTVQINHDKEINNRVLFRSH